MLVKILLKTVKDGNRNRISFQDIFFDDARASQALASLRERIASEGGSEVPFLIDRSVDNNATVESVISGVLADFA